MFSRSLEPLFETLVLLTFGVALLSPVFTFLCIFLILKYSIPPHNHSNILSVINTRLLENFIGNLKDILANL